MEPFDAADPAGHSLVRRAASRDVDAFDRLYSAHVRLVRGVVAAECGDAGSVDDLVQEVFVLVWQRLEGLRDPARFRPWLLQITRRVVIDHGRRARRRDGLVVEPYRFEGAPWSGPGPEECAEAFDLARRIAQGIAALSPRDAALLRAVADPAGCDAAHPVTQSLSPGAAKVALHRARARLAGRLQLSA